MKTKLIERTISKIYKIRDRIDLNPYFQREKVWKKTRKQYFIDTILKKWGIPKIYLLDVSDSSDKKNYLCIDGKQRLSTIIEYMTDEFPTNSKLDPTLGEKLYSQLTDVQTDAFDDFILSIEEVSDAKPEEISELFKRLQLGVPLNSGENLMAISGYLKEEIKSFYEHNFFKQKIDLQNTRFSHFVVCTQISFLEINGVSNLSIGKLEDFLEQNNDKNKIGFNVQTKIEKIKLVLNYLDKVFPAKNEILKNRATIVSFFLLISKFMDVAKIDGKESKFKAFFEHFSKELNKQIGLGTKATDTKLIHYQNSIIQGADKQNAIKNREDVLLQKLLEYDKSLYRLLSPQLSPEEMFTELYDKLELTYKTEENINNWIATNYPKVPFVNCKSSRTKANKETLPVHIRSCIHHKKHGKYTSAQILKSINILRDILK